MSEEPRSSREVQAREVRPLTRAQRRSREERRERGLTGLLARHRRRRAERRARAERDLHGGYSGGGGGGGGRGERDATALGRHATRGASAGLAGHPAAGGSLGATRDLFPGGATGGEGAVFTMSPDALAAGEPLGAGAGIALVARLHLTRWRRSRAVQAWAVGAVVTGYVLLGWGWAATAGDGGALLGMLAFAALVGVLVAAPGLGSSALGRDREAGVLGSLQVTALSAADLAVGAWAAATAVPLLGLLALLPAFVVAAVLDGAGVVAPAAAVLTLVVTTAVGAALGVGPGTAARRPAGVAWSAALVAGLSVGTLIAYALLVATTPQTTTLPVRVAAIGVEAAQRATADADGCVVVPRDVTRYRGDRWWPVLVASPFVSLADALGGADAAGGGISAALSRTIRATAVPPGDQIVEDCVAHRPSASPAAGTAAMSSGVPSSGVSASGVSASGVSSSGVSASGTGPAAAATTPPGASTGAPTGTAKPATPGTATPGTAPPTGTSAASAPPGPTAPTTTGSTAPTEPTEPTDADPETAAGPALWPVGLLGSLAVGGASLGWAVRRLRSPQDRVGRAPRRPAGDAPRLRRLLPWARRPGATTRTR